jgi:hypothetical protein
MEREVREREGRRGKESYANFLIGRLLISKASLNVSGLGTTNTNQKKNKNKNKNKKKQKKKGINHLFRYTRHW